MVLNLVFLLHALTAALFGLILILVPEHLVDVLGVPAGDVKDIAIDFARFYGVCCMGIAVATWLARISASTHARRLVVITMFILESIGLVVSFTVHYPLARAFAVVFYGVFALAYLYILLFRHNDI